MYQSLISVMRFHLHAPFLYKSYYTHPFVYLRHSVNPRDGFPQQGRLPCQKSGFVKGYVFHPETSLS
ncbi:Uncharacterized protein APZ42_030159 [Daphnia magna]|uniref:Uncharacterized protein n=1 Tax=Daphnia magna TaxID=35525 RepID=A0A0P6I7V2_9CRUS|nr:Uncharacterized protein APZ42_030159 [Daphnia magna]